MKDERIISKSTSSESERIAVAMSGGVDSSVAALLLKNQGYDVVGVTLKLQDCTEARGSRSCCGQGGIVRARAAAGMLNIPHYVVDCVKEFEQQVLRPAWDDYAAGRTPSPCLLCNEQIKFGLLMSWAKKIGASGIATGHYARVERSSGNEPSLHCGVDSDKDQSYFLAGLSKEQIASTIFPLGHMNKTTVRELSRSMNLITADTKDSQDACLVSPGQSFAEMLQARFLGEIKPGLIVDETGRALGRHPGIHRFTVGQRKGIHVPSTGRRWVKAVRPEDAAVVVTDTEDGLLSDTLVATDVSWISKPSDILDRVSEVKIRYRHAAEKARISLLENGSVVVHFLRPQRAVTPGQAAVFYDGDKVLGRGWIRAEQ
jgi:tRNA-specific 2-thiouridylase